MVKLLQVVTVATLMALWGCSPPASNGTSPSADGSVMVSSDASTASDGASTDAIAAPEAAVVDNDAAVSGDGDIVSSDAGSTRRAGIPAGIEDNPNGVLADPRWPMLRTTPRFSWRIGGLAEIRGVMSEVYGPRLLIPQEIADMREPTWMMTVDRGQLKAVVILEGGGHGEAIFHSDGTLWIERHNADGSITPVNDGVPVH